MTASHPETPFPPAGGPAGASARLLAEAARFLEEGRGAVYDVPAADATGRAAGGDLERRICARAAALPVAPELTGALARLRGAGWLAVALALAAGALAGAATARVALDASPVNVYLALLSLLGVHTLALAGWVVLATAGSGGAAAGMIGSAVLAAGRGLASLAKRGAAETAAVRAVTAMLREGGLARWALGGISHGVWFAFLAAAAAVIVVRLATLDFAFVWETTILGPEDYTALTRTLAAAPAALGFPTPGIEEIAASRRSAGALPTATAQAAWSGFLVGCLAVYGLLPRTAALAVCLLGARRARSRWRLNTTHVGYAVLRPRLLPEVRSTGIVDPAPPIPAEAPPAAAEATAPAGPLFPGAGPIGIAGLEIEPPAGGWPPPLPDVDWRDFGLIDDRAGRHRAIDAAASALPPPRGVLVVCDLTATPDRGAGTWIATLTGAVTVPVAVLLTAGQRLRRRTPSAAVGQRIADWRRLAATAGVRADRVIEADLDHLTETAARRLAGLMGANTDGVAEDPGPDAAFACIVDHARDWAGAPTDHERADLQIAIARLYRARRPDWRARLGLPEDTEPPSLETLRAGGERLLGLLPARLRANPRWLAAGAAAGALGCIAAAVLAAPVAVAALPAWAGLGAVVAAIIGPDTAAARPATEPSGEIGEAVAAATLFALVLHLQGRDEATITRLLDRALPDPSPPALADAAAAAAWLDGVRRRLAAAMAEAAA